MATAMEKKWVELAKKLKLTTNVTYPSKQTLTIKALEEARRALAVPDEPYEPYYFGKSTGDEVQDIVNSEIDKLNGR